MSGGLAIQDLGPPTGKCECQGAVFCWEFDAVSVHHLIANSLNVCGRADAKPRRERKRSADSIVKAASRRRAHSVVIGDAVVYLDAPPAAPDEAGNSWDDLCGGSNATH
jgi:hypothetical protein